MKLKEWHKITLIIIASLVFAGVFYSFLFKGFSKKAPGIQKESFLELIISGQVAERTVEDPVLDVFDTPSITSLQDILQAIRKAKIDNNIHGILFRPLAATMGWGKTEDVRNALLDFKSSGKPIYAYLEAAADRDYYLATAADSIVGPGAGILFINGFVSEPVFLKETLGKIGIEADFVTSGKYKNAPDTYTRQNMSDSQREVLNSILDEFYARYVDTLAVSRNLKATDIHRHIDRGLYTMEAAREYGLLDSLMYYQEFKDYLKQKWDNELEFVSLGRYGKTAPSNLGLKSRETIAVVFGVGTIVVGGADQFGQDGLITSGGMAKSIRKAADNDDVKAIILRIDSPGGSGLASDIIWREVVEAKKKKPVIVSISDVAASGGYYISMAADTIVAHPSSIVGSIGVYAGKFAWSKLYDKIGLKKEKVKRGRNADLFSETQTFTAEQREIIRKFIMDFYDEFITKAAEGRNTTPEEIHKIAQGRVWTGEQGLQHGLVDVLGDFHTAVQIAKEKAGIPVDDPVRLIIYPRLKTYFERLFDTSFSVDVFDIIPELQGMPDGMRNMVVALPYFQAGEPLYLMPYDLEVE